MVDVCDCWVKKRVYSCRHDKCPGVVLKAYETEDKCGVKIFTQEDFLRMEWCPPNEEKSGNSQEQELRAIRYLLTAYRAEQKREEQFLRRTIYTMQANRRLDWKLLLLVCGAGGFLGVCVWVILMQFLGSVSVSIPIEEFMGF